MPILTPSRPRVRRARRCAAVGVVVLAAPIAGCGGGSDGANADPASVVPSGAPVYAEVSVRPEGSTKADVMALSKKITGSADAGGQIVKAIEGSGAPGGASFKDDVDPWLGKKIGAAITGLRQSRSLDYVVVFASKDNDKAAASFKRGEKRTRQRSYKGVDYTLDGDGDAGAGVGDTFVFGTEAGVRAAIAADKSGKTLASSDKLKQARKRVAGDNLGFLYADPVSLVGLAASAAPQAAGVAGQLGSLLGSQTIPAVGAALTTAPDAVRLQIASGATTSAGSGSSTAADAKALGELPADALAAASLGNLGAAGRNLVTQVQKLGGPFGAIIGQLPLLTGLDLQRDVLSWMGQGSLFVRATRDGRAGIGGALVIGATDKTKAATFVTKARGLVRRFLSGQGVRVSSYRGQGLTGFQVRSSDLPDPVIVGTGAGRFVVAVGKDSIAEALKPKAKLADDPAFKQTVAKLGGPATTYVNLQGVFGLGAKATRGGKRYKQTQKMYLQALTGLAAGSTRSGGTTKTTVVVAVK